MDHITTSENTVLSNIWKVKLYPGERFDLPPTETENALIIVFVNEVPNQPGTLWTKVFNVI